MTTKKQKLKSLATTAAHLAKEVEKSEALEAELHAIMYQIGDEFDVEIITRITKLESGKTSIDYYWEDSDARSKWFDSISDMLNHLAENNSL